MQQDRQPDKRKVFNAFNPNEALSPQDPRYVDFVSEQGVMRLRQTMVDTIHIMEGSSCQLLSGHRGSGKTTELLRMAEHLREGSPRYFVVYCDADAILDLNNVEVYDVLLAIVQQVSHQLEQAGIDAEPRKFQRFWTDLSEVLRKEVDPYSSNQGLKDIEKVGMQIKRNLEHRAYIRSYLRPSATRFLEAINEVLEEANSALRQQGYEGLVVIVDALDRIIRQPLANMATSNQEMLFVNYASLLCGLKCHLIYTVPPILIYSVGGAMLHQLYNTEPQMLPMIPVETRHGERDNENVARLKQVIALRAEYAETDLESVFEGGMSGEAAERLCMVCGGYMRVLVSLVRQALLQMSAFPISLKDVDEAIRQVRNGFLVGLYTPHWAILREVAATKQISTERGSEKETVLQLLQNLVILQYMDADGPWYDINPIVRGTQQLESFLRSTTQWEL